MKELKHEANHLFKKGDYKSAEKVYTKALNLDPSHDEYCAVLHCNRAAALMGLQQYDRALLDCDNALRRKSRYPRALLRRARCNIALKKYAMAISDFDRYLKENPDDSGTESNADIELERAQAKRAMSASHDEIKKAYRKLALMYHPDKAKDSKQADVFKDMTAAYNVLSDTLARAEYDRELMYGGFGKYYEY
ncbi:hypothetical protein P43SY_000674 [Pythium insidiosum]|uniref:J domain-containing protein n=1 Tax=Pythium insidiosum TaxID=114742 RepID=A0AAD5LCF5_PYTIN|nr:hypothetical protein P43SY_000674 [Pythium insidiosum]KAJ0398568.1 hypothetical protein ATCC90586_010364 [Pythium insidiosum]